MPRKTHIYNRNNTQGNKKNERNKKKIFKIFKLTLFILFILLTLALAGTAALTYSYVRDLDLNSAPLRPSVTSNFYDRHGNEIADIYDEQHRIEVPLDDIPEHVQDAFIAIEDERFFDHLGVDPYAIGRAFIHNLRQGNWTDQGGSTITQQLVRNTFLDMEKTLQRKVQEAYISLKIEREYSKNEILEMYLNQIYFAHGAYGIEAASQIYFDKSASQLTIAEAALLAGIPRSPNYYSPFVNFEAAKQRQSLVLHKMHDLNFITYRELENALDEEINLAEPPSREYSFPYFIDYALHHELISILTSMNQFKTREEAYEAIYNRGLKIYTTLDTGMQQTTENVLNNESLYPQQTIKVDMELLRKLRETQRYEDYPEEVLLEEGTPQPQSAAVVADPNSGELLALVGGREYGAHNQLLRYLRPRQPGSAIKPIAAYAPAMEEKSLSPGTVMDDAPFAARSDYFPENFDGQFRGMITLREALYRSLNVPAVKTFMDMPPQLGLEYAERLGISTLHPDDYGSLSAVLGGLTEGVTGLDMAQAFAVLANEGIKSQFHAINRIEDRHGETIYERQVETEAILSPQTTYMINDILKDAVQRGTASNLNIARPVAAKTGTTDDNRDAYLVAYTPDIVVSFWMGHDITSMGRITGGSSSTIPFMNELLPQILENKEPRDFSRPEGVTYARICSKSGLRPGEHCPGNAIRSELFLSTHIPNQNCDLHVEKEICPETGLLAGDYCPEPENKIFFNRPEYVTTDHRWNKGGGRKPLDAELLPPQEYCEEHDEPGPETVPGDFKISLLSDPLRAHLVWDENYMNNTAEFQIWRRKETEEDFSLLDEVPGDNKEFIDVNITRGMTYTYRLVAVDEEGLTSKPAEWILKVPAVIDEETGNGEDQYMENND